MARGHPVEYVEYPSGEAATIDERCKTLIDNYLSNGYNVALAYRQMMGENQMKAQTSTSKGNQLFWEAETQRYLKSERKRLYDEKQIDKLRLMDRLSEIAFAEKGDKDYQTTHQLKAIEMLGKFGGFIEEKKGEGYGNIRITLDK